MADIELVEYSQEPGSLSPSHSPVVAKPDISLHQAAKEGREDVVRQWMKVDAFGVDAMDLDYSLDIGCSTAFHYAARYHHLNVMKILVDNGASPILRVKYHRSTAVHLAAKSSPKTCEQESQAIRQSMKYLVEELKLDINQLDFDKRCPLHIACSSANKAAVEVLLDQENIQLDLVDDWKSSVLHASCRNDNVELLQLVLEKLEEKDKLSNVLLLKDDKNRTALDLALSFDRLRMASKLVEFARNDEYSEIDPQLVLNYSQGKKRDAIVEFLNTCDPKNLACRGDGATILHQLAERGWVRATREISAKEPSLLNEIDRNGRTPLHYAAAKNNTEIVELLMNIHCTEVDTVDMDGFTPLLVAARQGCSETFTKLLEKADLNRTNKKGKNAVFLAAEADHSAILEAVKEKDPTVFRQVDRKDNTPLHVAAEHGNEKSVKVLLDQHIDVNAHNKDRLTPLHLAARNGHNGVVEMLLAYVPPSDGDSGEAIVDISAGDRDSNTALHLAAKEGHSSVAATLLSKGASVRAKNKLSQTPLHYAAQRGRQELVELLISEHGAEIEARDEYQETPLHHAAYEDHPDVVTTLLNHKADLTAVDNDGRNALAVAIERRQDDVAMEIVKHDEWRDAMRHTYRRGRWGDGPESTPMRTLVRDMPEVALEVINRCTKVNSFREGDYEVQFDYEFLEDLGEPAAVTDTNGSPEDNNSTASISMLKRGRSCRPSYLLNRLAPMLFKSKMKGQYTMWGPTVFDQANHPLQLMVVNKRTELLNHPLISALIAYKWKRAWPLYLANILFYLVFLCFLTAYALVVPNPQSELCLAVSNHTFSSASSKCENVSNLTELLAYKCGECSSNRPFLYAAGAIVLLCVLVRVIMEFMQFLEQPAHYFLNRENWLELFLYCFTLIFMSSLGSVCVCPKPWQWQIGALAVFIAWIHLSIFVRKLPQLGLYIIMFEDIVLTFIKLAIPALLLVLAFSMAFYMMFFVPSPLFAASPFATPGLSIIKAMTMAVGEMDFESIFRLTSGGVGDSDEVPTPIPYTGVSILLWIFFLILMPILLMNLLTGLAVGDVDRIQSDAEYRKLELQIELVLIMEEAFQAFRTWFVPLDEDGGKKIIVNPNQHRHRKRFLSLLAGVDKNPTREDISKSLSKPIKHIEIEHVHEQTTTLLAKFEKQGIQQKEAAKLNTKLRKDIVELKAGMEELKAELSAEQRAEMTGLRTEMMGDLKTAMAMHKTEMKAALSIEMAELRTEVGDLKRTIQRMEALLLRGLAGREGTGGAGLVGEEGHSSAPR